ncbi:MAG: carboxypeptidase-like regulatory domain-containing protein [Cyclobacteriaceae bacterium]
MQRKLILIGIALSLALAGTAQNNVTLSGYIQDESTGEELIGATIQVQGTSTGTVTNAYGFYSLTLPAGSYRFVVSYVGYTPYIFEMNLTGNQTLNFQLTPDANELEEVVVKAEADNRNVTVNQMSVARLEPKLVKELPAVLGEPDVIRSLQLLPGVTTVADGTAGFNVRGGSVDQNLILLGEGTLYNSSHLFGLFSVANPEACLSRAARQTGGKDPRFANSGLIKKLLTNNRGILRYPSTNTEPDSNNTKSSKP